MRCVVRGASRCALSCDDCLVARVLLDSERHDHSTWLLLTPSEVPIIVGRCGAYLKNKTDVEGVFRVSGSAKRMRELQAVFEEAPKVSKRLLSTARSTLGAQAVVNGWEHKLSSTAQSTSPSSTARSTPCSSPSNDAR